LELLRFVKTLASSAINVLGNHDLYVLVAAAGSVKIRKEDTIAEILDAPDCEELLFWLRHQPLLHLDTRLGYAMIHAGLPPQWSPEQARSCAHELEAVLQNFDSEDFFEHMCDEKPLQWNENLTGWERLRFIANCFTQLRYCDREGRLDLSGRRRGGSGKKRSMPWFLVSGPQGRQQGNENSVWPTGHVGRKVGEESTRLSPGYGVCQWRPLYCLSSRRRPLLPRAVQKRGGTLAQRFRVRSPELRLCLEPIPKQLSQQKNGGELHESRKVRGAVPPSIHETTLPTYPGTQPLWQLVSLVATQPTTVVPVAFSGSSDEKMTSEEH